MMEKARERLGSCSFQARIPFSSTESGEQTDLLRFAAGSTTGHLSFYDREVERRHD